jgi:8-oxo-dGTP pyrophosphatase MutT (NUDIX family)
MVQIPKIFRNSNYEDVAYDGSEVTWRISIYGVCLIDDKILLVHHTDETLFDIPGGGVELDESLEQALSREGLEEAGWEITPTKLLFTMNDWFYHTREKKFYRTLQFYYLVSGKKVAEPSDNRIIFADLVPLSELSNYKLYPNIERALQQIADETA